MYRTRPVDSRRMPPGIPYIISNEAAERFSFYGMRTILVVFMVKYLWLMDARAATPMSDTQAVKHFHQFVFWVYLTPLFGALLSDIFLGKYRTIMILSVVYCLGHAALACMGLFGNSTAWLAVGLGLICLGSGGIKPCVSAHVGDQFGPSNSHLLTRIYNWFYFSINLGSTVSTLLTPWLLEWYGPHWAFGVPGVLMAIATLLFWLGRHRFVHVPAGGFRFFRELGSADGIVALLKLIPLFVFIAVFWSLYDQTGSTWVLQATQMNRHFFGIEWLESQIQALNPILILTFIPLFALAIYPAISRFFPLTPLRKIGIGLALMTAAFALSTLIQSWIDSGQAPSIAWQFLAYVLLTASEIMVSIVGLEFAYTQAPKTMKSMVMSLYLSAVALGNLFTSQINGYIEVPSAAQAQLKSAIQQLPADWQNAPRHVVLPGHDGQTGTSDDYVAHLSNGSLERLVLPGQDLYQHAADLIAREARRLDHRFPPAAFGENALGADPWGHPIRYEIVDATNARLISAGPDGRNLTPDDQGLVLTITQPSPPREKSWFDALRPQEPWLDRRKREFGVPVSRDVAETTYDTRTFTGGLSRLSGASYYRFFTWLMLGTTLVFVPFAWLYRTRSYLHAGEAEPNENDG